MKKQKGFTLVETVIVIVLIIIVSAVAIPEFRHLAINGKLKAAARDIMADMTRAREKAVSENNTFTMVFDQGNNNYTVPALQSAGTETKTPVYFSMDIRITGISFGGGSTLTFQTRGTVFPAAPVNKTLTLTNMRGSTATITITTTGRVYVEYVWQ